MGQSSGELSNVQSSSAEGNCSASADKESRANHLVLDCAGWAYVDATAVERLAEVRFFQRANRFFNKIMYMNKYTVSIFWLNPWSEILWY